MSVPPLVVVDLDGERQLNGLTRAQEVDLRVRDAVGPASRARAVRVLAHRAQGQVVQQRRRLSRSEPPCRPSQWREAGCSPSASDRSTSSNVIVPVAFVGSASAAGARSAVFGDRAALRRAVDDRPVIGALDRDHHVLRVAAGLVVVTVTVKVGTTLIAAQELRCAVSGRCRSSPPSPARSGSSLTLPASATCPAPPCRPPPPRSPPWARRSGRRR